jgi:hypothetical protein
LKKTITPSNEASPVQEQAAIDLSTKIGVSEKADKMLAQ